MLQRKISNYLSYIVERGINPTPLQPVEIVTSSYIDDIVSLLKGILYKHNVGDIIVTYIDGKIIEEEINRDWEGFLNKKIKMYNSLIEKGFCRITLLSPFLFPIARTNSVDMYRSKIKKLEFVHSYFYSGCAQHTIAAIPNPYWAGKLQMSVEELWMHILDFYIKKSPLDDLKEILDKLNIDTLHFKTGLGTDLRVGLTSVSRILGKSFETISGVEYEPNIPSLEIYTSPNKYDVNGVLVGSRPLFYNGKIINSFRLKFKDGRVEKSDGLDEILALDDGLYYSGEIAIVLPHDEIVYYNTLLDENLGCHLALGQGFNNEIKSPLVNNSIYHIDLVFGTNDITVVAKLKDGRRLDIIRDGKFKLGGIKNANERHTFK